MATVTSWGCHDFIQQFQSPEEVLVSIDEKLTRGKKFDMPWRN